LDPDGTKTDLGSILTGPIGAFPFNDVAPTTGRFTYLASFAGEDGQPKALATANIQVHQPPGS
jgi:hypothetical protein